MHRTRMKEYRVRFGLKQEDLAKLVGVRREKIGSLEIGKYNPSLKLAVDIAKVFHTTVEDIFEFLDYHHLMMNSRYQLSRNHPLKNN